MVPPTEEVNAHHRAGVVLICHPQKPLFSPIILFCGFSLCNSLSLFFNGVFGRCFPKSAASPPRIQPRSFFHFPKNRNRPIFASIPTHCPLTTRWPALNPSILMSCSQPANGKTSPGHFEDQSHRHSRFSGEVCLSFLELSFSRKKVLCPPCTSFLSFFNRAVLLTGGRGRRAWREEEEEDGSLVANRRRKRKKERGEEEGNWKLLSTPSSFSFLLSFPSPLFLLSTKGFSSSPFPVSSHSPWPV